MGRRGLIHATPQVVTQWSNDHFLERGSDGRLRTQIGTLVLCGQGYASGTSQKLAYATGMIEIHRTEVITYGDPSSWLDRSNNTYVIRVERFYVVSIDRQCGVTAVSVTAPS